MTANDHEADLACPAGETPDEAALAWFVRMQSGEASAADRAGHQAWLAADPAHRRADARLAQLWGEIGTLPDPRRQRQAAPRLSRRGIMTGAVAAGLGLAALPFTGLPELWLSDVHTATGETRQLVLDDGTEVDLDARTALALDFTDVERRVHLQRGRARFTLHDDTRPFLLQAGSGVVHSRSGRFSAHLWGQDTTIAIESQAVQLEIPGQGAIDLAAGKRVSFNARGIGRPESYDPLIDDAWLRGKLIFEDRPLGQVIADVNRYRRGHIHASSSSLLDMRVSGIFDMHDPDAVLTALTASLPLQATHLTPYLVVLHPA